MNPGRNALPAAGDCYNGAAARETAGPRRHTWQTH